MKNKITVVLIGTKYSEWDVEKLKTNQTQFKEETEINIFCFSDSKDIEKKLSSCYGYDCIVTIGNIADYPELFGKSFEIRKKWVHFKEYEPQNIVDAIIATFKLNLNRNEPKEPVFSFCTCAYKTDKEKAQRLYNSILNQTYENWNWWILDDSPEGEISYFNNFKDPRIFIIRNKTVHGNIGFNKHLLGMACTGDYIVEVDHDDELTSDCLFYLKKAFNTYPDCDFVYSYAIEELDGNPILYDDGFALGLGRNEEVPFENGKIKISITPDVNALSMRHIVGVPNHVRCWKKSFYQKIGGHNTDLSVCDDFELLIRTALNGKMCKIPRVLYIQHEGTSLKGERNETTQSKRFGEILRLGKLIKEKYDLPIHNFFLSKGLEDPYWIEEKGYSNIHIGPQEGTVNINYVLDANY